MAYTGNSIVDYLKSVGQDSSYAARAQMAASMGISNYTGTAAQNTQLLNTLKTSSAPAAAPAPAPAPVVAPPPAPVATTPAPPAAQPAEQTGSVTGNATLDGILTALQGHLDTQLASGAKFNPNIEITPATVQQFLDQATGEIDPFYQNQYKVIKSDLSRNLTELGKSYDINKRQNEGQFKQDLNNKREQLAGSGLAYSGFRGQAEKQLADNANLENESAALKAGSAAADAISSAEKTIGSSNLPGSYPSLSEYGASTSGSGSFTPTRTLNFSPVGGVTGSSQYAERGDVRSLQDFLTNQEVTKRTLNFAG